jgi:hypothetical protein
MKRNTIFIISSILLIVLLSITLFVSSFGKQEYERNGFNRIFTPNNNQALLLKEQAISPQYKSMYYDEGNKLYLIAHKPFQLIELDTTLIIQDTTRINLGYDEKELSALDVFINKGKIKIFCRNYPLLLYGDLNRSTSLKDKKIKIPIYSRLILTPDTSLILRAYDKQSQNQVFMKINMNDSNDIKSNELIPASNDYGFSSDGQLVYNKTNNKLIYVQYYQNIFYCMDTNLSLNYKAQTIDTTNSNHIKTEKFFKEKKGSLMSSVPLKIINKDCATDRNNIYIVSNLKADNERNDLFRDNIVIDVYDVNNSNYLKSFYIPKIDGKKTIKIEISGGKLYALYPGKISIYKIPI